MKPQPEPIDPAKLPELARQVMADAKFPMLATLDGDQPRVRPVSPVKTEGFVVWVASLRSSQKTGEIEANTKVELCYLAPGHDQIRITGRAVDVVDRAERQMIWDENPLLRQFLGAIDNPEFVLYRVVPEQVRFMREWALEYHDVEIEQTS